MKNISKTNHCRYILLYSRNGRENANFLRRWSLKQIIAGTFYYIGCTKEKLTTSLFGNVKAITWILWTHSIHIFKLFLCVFYVVLCIICIFSLRDQSWIWTKMQIFLSRKLWKLCFWNYLLVFDFVVM